MNTSMLRLLLVPVMLLLGVTAVSWWLFSTTATHDVDLHVEVDSPHFDDVPRCSGESDDPLAASVRNQFGVGGLVRSEQLFNCPRAFDKFTVTYVGEVVGELIPRRGGVWVQVNDDAYALSDGPLHGHRNFTGFNSGVAVWLPDGTHEIIERVGKHQVRGDVLEITGTFWRADPRDGGGLTLRAHTVQLVAPGVVLDEPLNRLQLVVAVLLTAGAFGALLLAYVARRNR